MLWDIAGDKGHHTAKVRYSERYQEAIAKRFHHPGPALRGIEYTRPLVDLEVDPINNLAATRSGLPPFMRRGRSRAALPLCSVY